MSSLFGIGAGSASTGFYPFEIGQSLRLDGDARLSHSHQSAPTLQTKATVSFWIKLHDNIDRNIVLHTGVGVGNNTHMTLAIGGGTSYNGISVGQYGRNLYVNPSSSGVMQRDFTNFYHFFMSFDSTSSTASERVVKLYINGEQITVGTFTQMGQGDLFPLTAQTNAIYIGGHTPGYNYFTSGNIAELIVVDGQALNTTDFGLNKSGTWVPIEYTGTYGNNGFRLTFEGSGTATTTDGTTAQTNIGDDQSGNGNNFAVYSSSVGSHDILKDSPTNNFCVLNSLSGASHNATLSEGNLKASGSDQARIGTFGMTSGKWYWEGRCGAIGGSNFIGIVRMDYNLKNQGSSHTYGRVYSNNGYLYIHDSSSSVNTSTTYTTGDIIGVAVDLDAGTIKWYKNGTEVSGSTISDLNTHADGDQGWLPWTNFGNATGDFVLNFGQDSSFAGLETAQGNSDSGDSTTDFYYTPPSGYLALCSANLDDSTISPAQETQAGDHMNVITYTGDDANSRSLTGVGFQPDLIWYKHRTINYGHVIYDSSRGTGEAHQRSDASIADGAYNDLYGTLTSFDADGITIARGDSSGVESAFFNTNGQGMVGWNWKCGGTTPSKTYKVVVVSDSGNKYRFRNSADSATFAQSAVTLNLQEGGTYVFDWSDSTAQGHPIRFSTTSDGTHNSGTEYTTGVVKDDSAYKTTITVASSAPPLYYYCQNHSGMGGGVNTNTTHGSSNFDGNVKSIVQTNELAGFSIVKYTGTGTNPNADGVSVGHGLTSTPQIIFHKNRDSGTAGNNYWTVWTPFHGANNHSFLSFTTNNTAGWNGYNTIGSTTFSPPNATYGNVLNDDYICYLWHSVDGYSKIGSYEMNYNSDGTYVFCGFRPRFLVTKPIDQAGSWSVYDSARDPFNDGDANMSQWENATTEASFANSAVDFLSTGFKLRQSSDGYSNIASNTAIFMAFAEQPFKFSNAK